MATKVPTTFTMPPKSWVTFMDRVLEMVSTSLVRRDIKSPLEWVSKNFRGRPCMLSNSAFLSRREVNWATSTILVFCTYTTTTFTRYSTSSAQPMRIRPARSPTPM